jgi:hypothetical protein
MICQCCWARLSNTSGSCMTCAGGTCGLNVKGHWPYVTAELGERPEGPSEEAWVRTRALSQSEPLTSKNP